MDFVLAGGVAQYSASEALDAVKTYAFATDTIRPSRRFRDTFAPHTVPSYGYRTYDCIPASDQAEFTDLDLLVGAGLNAGLSVRVLARLRSFADRAAPHLQRAHESEPDFLGLPWDELSDDPPENSAGWHLNQAWQHGMATPYLDVARVYKTLHHKRPRLVPLLDNKTIKPIRLAAQADGFTVWQRIRCELDKHKDQFRTLEDEFASLATSAGGIVLSPLRLYDILVWLKVTGNLVRLSRGAV